MSGLTVAIVLAGGEGRRMGGGKPLKRIAGVRLIDRAVAIGRQCAPMVAVCVREAAQTGGDCAVPLVFDPPGLAGPIAGLAAGFDFARRACATRLLTLPCDMPALPADLAVRLQTALVAPAMVAMAACAGRLQPACALWDIAAAADLPDYCASGRSSLRGFAERVGPAIAVWPDSSAGAFANANTPADLAGLETACLEPTSPPA